MFFIYLILAFVLFIGVAAQKNYGWKLNLIRIAGILSFLLSAVAFITPYFMTITVHDYSVAGSSFDVETANRLTYLLSGVIGFSGGIVFIGLGLALLEFGRLTAVNQNLIYPTGE